MTEYGIQGWPIEIDWPAAAGPPGYDVLVSQGEIPNDGGWEIQIANVASFPEARYRVHLGPNGDANDPICYPGNGHTRELAEVVDGRFITVWSPIVAIGGPYFLFFEDEALDGTGDPSDSAVIEIVPRLYRSKLLSIRKLFPPRYKTGYRLAKRDIFPQV